MESVQALNSIDAVNAVSRRPKLYRDRSDPFSMDDDEFKKRYRFTKPTMRTIIKLVQEDLQMCRRGMGTSPKLQVLTAIRCWARREAQEDAGDHHGLSQASVSRICNRVARALARHSAEFIKMPSSFVEEQSMIRDFAQIRGFPSVIGCIGCTHIKIKKCRDDAAQCYINSKGFYSLNVQVTCDAGLLIQDIVARWQGSTHNSQIFNESTLKEGFEAGTFRGRLLGDSGYRLEPYLFTPILRPQNGAEERYNEAHIATLNCIERCFGVWKQHFQCLLYGMSVKLPNAKTTIEALAVLHNIAMAHDESDPEPEPIIHDENDPEPERITGELQPNAIDNASSNESSAILQAFITRHFGGAN